MKRLIIFGTGNGFQKVKEKINFNSAQIVSFLDNDKVKQNLVMDGVNIHSPQFLTNIVYDYIIIASQYYEQINIQLQNLGVNKEKIISFYKYNYNYIVYKYDFFNYEELKYEVEFMEIYDKCKEYTMTSIERMYALYKSVKYIIKNNIEGDIVECGVWKGGSSMVAALTCIKYGDMKRKIYMYDTYEGMSAPCEKDVRFDGKSAQNELDENNLSTFDELCYASIEETKKNLISTGYPEEKLKFIKGKVEDTIPGVLPGKISILRLDTDWYESTHHELVYLYPRLNHNGVVIFDDYGYWKGQKEAVNEYFKENNINILLNQIDLTGMIGIKNF
jgi:Macrocin-O-methyltransferase (TylF).